MDKAYDLKGLVEKMKPHGLELTEDVAKLVLTSVFDWVQESALMSESKADDFAAIILPAVKPFVLAQLDKIDGKADVQG